MCTLRRTHFLLISERSCFCYKFCFSLDLLTLLSIRSTQQNSYIVPDLHFWSQTLHFPLFLGTIWFSCQDEINFPSLLALCFRKKIIFYTRVYCTIYHRLLYCSHLCVFISCRTCNLFLGGQNNIFRYSFMATTYSNIWHMC